MRHLLGSVFLGNPAQKFATAIIIKVGIDIGKRYTVWIQETLKQKVILDWVDFSDAQAICHRRAGSRATSRTNRNAQFVERRVDEVLHNKEVTRETHRLHDVQLELYLVGNVLFERIAV